MEGKGIDRRGFIVGSAAAAAGLSFGLPSLAFAEGEVIELPPVGKWPYAVFTDEEIQAVAVNAGWVTTGGMAGAGG
jgi:hypothetical protein